MDRFEAGMSVDTLKEVYIQNMFLIHPYYHY